MRSGFHCTPRTGQAATTISNPDHLIEPRGASLHDELIIDGIERFQPPIFTASELPVPRRFAVEESRILAPRGLGDRYEARLLGIGGLDTLGVARLSRR